MFTPLLRSPMPTGPKRRRISPRTGQSSATVPAAGGAPTGPAVAAGQPLTPAGCVDPLDLFDRRRTKPVVCGVQGWCLTIGVELLLAADIRLAASDTRFAQMEVQRGIMPFGGASLRLPQVAGWGNAMRWLLTGGEFGAEEALRIGLVQDVVSPDRVRQQAEMLAAEVAAQAPLAVQA
ncbi:MAG: enoyl-CoA hydratase/isomerase family protein, partial [Alphaproteobacteria bacterium]|nr:enoyl-CoA hydratase/isomerase family protein [Alphaproteobacteria bacterium]